MRRRSAWQNCILGALLLCTVETAFYYGYFTDSNVHNSDAHALLGIAAFLSAARYSTSLVIALVVSMGYRTIT